MRARYTAFVRGDHAFLWRTLHRDHDDRARGTERELRVRLAQHARRARYRGLAVLDRDGPDADGTWRVLFHVQVALAGRDASFVELSSFAADDEEPIKYLAGVSRPMPRAPEGLTIARFG